MVVIEPSFEIDEKGRVICQSHSKFPHFIQPAKTYFEELQMEKELTCISCSHYINDDCYFPKSELKKIRFRVHLRRFRCELCGNPITKLHNVLHKKLTERRGNVEIALICCSCWRNSSISFCS